MVVAPVAPVSGRKQTFHSAVVGPWETEGDRAADGLAGSGSGGQLAALSIALR